MNPLFPNTVHLVCKQASTQHTPDISKRFEGVDFVLFGNSDEALETAASITPGHVEMREVVYLSPFVSGGKAEGIFMPAFKRVGHVNIRKYHSTGDFSLFETWALKILMNLKDEFTTDNREVALVLDPIIAEFMAYTLLKHHFHAERSAQAKYACFLCQKALFLQNRICLYVGFWN